MRLYRNAAVWCAVLVALAFGFMAFWCGVPTAGAEAGIIAGGGSASILRASPAGKALCPFVVKSESGTPIATIDCSGEITASSSVSIGGNFILGWTGSQANLTTNLLSHTVTAIAPSGTDAFAVQTNGERVHFGVGTADYASSDGTIVTFAGPISTQDVRLDSSNSRIYQNWSPAPVAIAGGTSATELISIQTGTGIERANVSSIGTGWFAAGVDADNSKITSVANGTVSDDAVNLGQIQSGSIAARSTSTDLTGSRLAAQIVDRAGTSQLRLTSAILEGGGATLNAGATIEVYDDTKATVICTQTIACACALNSAPCTPTAVGQVITAQCSPPTVGDQLSVIETSSCPSLPAAAVNVEW